LDEFKPRRIFIEPTGVADPIAIVEVCQEIELHERLEVHKVITVLDAEYWENREYFGSFFLSQVKEADLILLNKIDNVVQDKIPRYLKEIHEVVPHAQVVPTVHCGVDPETFGTDGRCIDFGLNLNQFFHSTPRSDQGTGGHPDFHDRHRTDGGHLHAVEEEGLGYVAFSFRDSALFDEDCFKRFTEELPWELFRMKGVVRFRDRTALVNFVGGKSEWIDWDNVGETRLAFVGWNVNRENTLRKLEKCATLV
jgi:G3E family GTPase